RQPDGGDGPGRARDGGRFRCGPRVSLRFHLVLPGGGRRLVMALCTPFPVVVSVTLPALAVHVMPELVVSPAAVRATATKSVVWFDDTTSVSGDTMTLETASSRDVRDGTSQAASATVPARAISRRRASRCGSLCLNVMTEFLPNEKGRQR